ncbi:MAG TPA: hypothetical protein VHX14_13355 [Thermoanaerobaculia bacterium]|nr:hypothetical protein [Thermoanaerobaculia bacterium]
MPVPSVDDLRRELRDRGYLSHGIERWFAHDPFTAGRSSRAFWRELTTVAGKASLLIALFAIVPLVAIMVFRNHPLSAGETLLLSLLYGVTGFAVSFALLIFVALVLKLRPAIAIDTPRALLAISFAASAIPAGAIAIWWYGFDAPPSWPELLLGLALIVALFLFSSVAVSAALLSFSIYELQRIPAIHRRSRTIPMTMAAIFLIAVLFLPTYASQDKGAIEPPLQVVTTPSTRRIALIAVDGLTSDILASRPDLSHALPSIYAVAPLRGGSTTERWASLGTGVKTYLHGVRSIEGVRLRNGGHLLQTLSQRDLVLRDLGGAVGLAKREPLPPTVRRRDFVWEIFAARGIPSVAVNWWTADDAHAGALDSIGQMPLFAAAAAGGGAPEIVALRVDELSMKRLLQAADKDKPRVATVYLPALDVILNRLALDPSARLTASVRALDGVVAAVAALRGRGFDVIVAGMPGDHQAGQAVLASNIVLAPTTTPFDVAPTLCSLIGFPPSNEMSGRTLAGSEPPRIASYGPRVSHQQATKMNQEYYENLRSLGYIR